MVPHASRLGQHVKPSATDFVFAIVTMVFGRFRYEEAGRFVDFHHVYNPRPPSGIGGPQHLLTAAREIHHILYKRLPENFIMSKRHLIENHATL
ncbi:hypothetical protein EVAR_48670_1 [Eumeta japonica]|uniref:Uncharacterized protein n=1 Tax=Eumeta variegata TaxID=151549 RepID=A0A4C1X9Y7_EUMVA|nr:hypothetical protein EVAR_48670_1 [Eumeta japonica]